MFKVGDRVKLRPDCGYRDDEDNPWWGGKFGKISGTVTKTTPMNGLYVDWDNGHKNGYSQINLDSAQNPVEQFREKEISLARFL